jgi:GUN4-like/TIR domain
MMRSPNVEKFDVFLCHNSEDKAFIRDIAQQLRAQNLVPWLDEEQLIPGRDWLDILEQDITKIKTVAVFVGRSGLRPWQKREVSVFLREFVERGIPVIPVLLKNALEQPMLPILLKNMSWVDFRRQEPEPFQSLLWGITGNRAPSNRSITSLAVSQEPTGDRQPQSVQPRQNVQDAQYQKLEELLKAQKWIDADRETYRMLIIAVGKKRGDMLEEEELLNFPCANLKKIDGLWVKYSQGRFRFSVQKQIYVECGGKLDSRFDKQVWEKFGDRVGWRPRGEWRYSYDDLIKEASLIFPRIFPGGWGRSEFFGGGRCGGDRVGGVFSLLSHRDLRTVA